VSIGDNVFVGPNSTLDSCKLDSFSYVGMGASVGADCHVESFGVVAAGAALPAGTTVPSGQIYAGSPAKYLRDLTQQEKHVIGEHHLEMQQLAQVYYENCELSHRDQLDQFDRLARYFFSDPQEKVEDKTVEIGMPQTHEDFEHMENRVYHDYVSSADYDLHQHALEHDYHKRTWVPYEQDMSQYPEVFRKYQENYDKFEQAKTRFENEDPVQASGDTPLKRQSKIHSQEPWEAKWDTHLPRYTGT